MVKHVFFWPVFFFTLTFFMLAFLPESVFVFFTISVCCTFIVYMLRFRTPFYLLYGIAILLFIGASAAIFWNYTDISQKELYPYIGKTIQLNGICDDAVKKSASSESFVLHADSLTYENKTYQIDENVLLHRYTKEKTHSYTPERRDRVTVSCKIEVPQTQQNTGGFDYAKYCMADNIFFVATYTAENIQKTNTVPMRIVDYFRNIRDRFSNLFDEIFPQKESNILKAYVLGDNRNSTEEQNDLYSASGLSHVLAVSGSHIVMFMSLMMILLQILHIHRRIQLTIGAVGVIFFVCLTGLSPSAVRAGIICLLTSFAEVFYLGQYPVSYLAIAAAGIYVFSPGCVYDISFQLSFATCLGIALFTKYIRKSYKSLYERPSDTPFWERIRIGVYDIINIGVCSHLFATPVMCGIFGKMSLMSVISTLVLTPLLSPLLLFGILTCAVSCIYKPLTFLFAGPAYIFAKGMNEIANFFANYPNPFLRFGKITPFFLFVYGLCLFLVKCIFVENNKRMCYSAISLILACLFVFTGFSFSKKNNAYVSFINVGQGDCAYISAPGNADILIDGGGKQSDTSVADYTIYPYLSAKGVWDIEYMIATHAHADHINGLIGLIDLMPVKNLVISEIFAETKEGKRLLEKANAKQIPIITLRTGDTVETSGGLKITSIYAGAFTEDENDTSMVLRLVYGETSFLFTADSTAAIESILTQSTADISCDVLKVAHHGSKASTSTTFLNRAGPKYAYIPVGKNSYGHPGENVLTKLNDVGMPRVSCGRKRRCHFLF